MLRTRPWVPYLYVAPAIALLALIFAYPLVRVFDFSTRLIRGSSGPYVGSLNYRLVWDDPVFHEALKHSALLLLGVGLDGLAQDWLGSEKLSLLTVGTVIVWREVGFGIVLFLARLLSMPDEPIEAARIDGAGWWQRLRFVILPELRGT